MKQKKVTRRELRSMKVGESKRFELISPAACQSASVSAGQMQLEKDENGANYVFKCHCPLKDKLDGIITITRLS